MVRDFTRLKFSASQLLICAGFMMLIPGSSLAVPLSNLEDARQQKVELMPENVELRYLVEQVHRGINEYRASLNLPPLRLNTQINHQAEIHSQKMAQQVVKFSHHGFNARIGALKGSIAYRRAAENVAFNQGYKDPAQTAIAGWIKSEGHHQNMVGDFNLTGIGVARNSQGEYYFTQIFIKGK
ncbi:MAG: CAP domain-containing protein [Cyanobacteria bacterium J06631_2]